MDQAKRRGEAQRSLGSPARAADGTTSAVLETRGWKDGYVLLDSGGGRKLERFGERTLARPEPQALWAPSLDPAEWAKAGAAFDAGAEDDDGGRWLINDGLGASWRVPAGGLSFECRLTAFRHVGLFPEQAPHWRWMQERIAARTARPFRLLNLFAYTGAASLIAAAAGAEVAHVDASKKAIAWARDNQRLNALEGKPVRWLCDDATKFAAREGRRGARYDAIILDPPKFGRGPNNETWELFKDLPALLNHCAALLADDASFLILTAYALRLSHVSLHELLRDAMTDRGGAIDTGELVQLQEAGARRLSMALYARWSRDG
jgi:23S rRNA (cytosine1962-C5)-methyltransferase